MEGVLFFFVGDVGKDAALLLLALLMLSGVHIITSILIFTGWVYSPSQSPRPPKKKTLELISTSI